MGFISSNSDIAVALIISDILFKGFNLQVFSTPSDLRRWKKSSSCFQQIIKTSTIMFQVDYVLAQIYFKKVEVIICFGQFLFGITKDILQF